MAGRGRRRTGVELHEVHRFANGPVRRGGTLHWDILALYADVLDGLRRAARTPALGRHRHRLLGRRLRPARRGRARCSATPCTTATRAPTASPTGRARSAAAELYAVTGMQQLPFNTLYQLAAARGTPALAAARTLLLIPDLLAYWLTGEVGRRA